MPVFFMVNFVIIWQALPSHIYYLICYNALSPLIAFILYPSQPTNAHTWRRRHAKYVQSGYTWWDSWRSKNGYIRWVLFGTGAVALTCLSQINSANKGMGLKIVKRINSNRRDGYRMINEYFVSLLNDITNIIDIFRRCWWVISLQLFLSVHLSSIVKNSCR